MSGDGIKGEDPLHLMGAIGLNSGSGDLADICLSNGEAFKGCSGTDAKLQNLQVALAFK